MLLSVLEAKEDLYICISHPLSGSVRYKLAYVQPRLFRSSGQFALSHGSQAQEKQDQVLCSPGGLVSEVHGSLRDRLEHETFVHSQVPGHFSLQWPWLILWNA